MAQKTSLSHSASDTASSTGRSIWLVAPDCKASSRIQSTTWISQLFKHKRTRKKSCYELCHVSRWNNGTSKITFIIMSGHQHLQVMSSILCYDYVPNCETDLEKWFFQITWQSEHWPVPIVSFWSVLSEQIFSLFVLVRSHLKQQQSFSCFQNPHWYIAHKKQLICSTYQLQL